MLTIGRDQMDRFRAARRDPFLRLILYRLRTAFRAETAGLSDDGLMDLVARGMALAHRHGVTAEVDVARFLECCACHGLGFVEDPALPWAGNILRRTDLSGHEKMNAVDACDDCLMRPRRRDRVSANLHTGGDRP